VRVRPHGVRGEVRFVSLSGIEGRFSPGLSVLWRGPDGRDVPLTVESVRERGEDVFARFAEVPDRTRAEGLAGGTLWAPAATSPPLEPGTYYHHQLLGLEVTDEAGAHLGRLSAILPGGVHDNYEVRMPDDRRFLVPAVAAFVVRVDLDAARVVIRPAPGLIPEPPRPKAPRRSRRKRPAA
jgi:16S rRNA processing protein RimM